MEEEQRRQLLNGNRRTSEAYRIGNWLDYNCKAFFAEDISKLDIPGTVTSPGRRQGKMLQSLNKTDWE